MKKCPDCGQETLVMRYDDPAHGGMDYGYCTNLECNFEV